MDGERDGGAPTKSTMATGTEHFNATHMGTEEGGGIQRTVPSATEERGGDYKSGQRDHISGGKIG